MPISFSVNSIRPMLKKAQYIPYTYNSNLELKIVHTRENNLDLIIIQFTLFWESGALAGLREGK